ncbi:MULTISPECIES: hypothetical protein [unclassified Cryobacterium]|uniref:hypothetical protein n=1 Tax=unclassified Cryobacterium TaxID=2649013 RepID=UPI002AB4EEC7|nr:MULTISPECIES: hypothetical protein [unclassified Cryobacterium]MDY7557806.1 hypothetical protein [Cryobacterium sp. 10C3]MEB0004689.1 hypothetical protein [Cryobacterium sp. RTC2.1]MEB0305724.1 hypothetical protein [Cryobacterium sp. 10I1]
MKRMSYCGTTFLTTNTVADALLEFAATLSEWHKSEVVEVPSYTADGSEILIRLLLASGSELISIPENTVGDEPVTHHAVSVLRYDINSLASVSSTESIVTRAVASASEDWSTEDHWDDVY